MTDRQDIDAVLISVRVDKETAAALATEAGTILITTAEMDPPDPRRPLRREAQGLGRWPDLFRDRGSRAIPGRAVSDFETKGTNHDYARKYSG